MNTEKRAPWREPMVWLVATIPLMSFVAVGGLIWAANQSGGVDGVSDAVARTGQIQTTNTTPAENAARLKLSAVLKFDGKRIDVFPTTGNFDRSGTLVLKLHHPVSAKDDKTVVLQTSVNGWHAVAALPTDHDWLLELAPEGGQWRLDGRLPAGQHAGLLAPSITLPQ